MKKLLLTCDLEEFTLPLDFGRQITKKQTLDKSYKGLLRFSELIKKYNTKVTFFVTENIAKTYTNYIKTLFLEGHEIGIHASVNFKGKKIGLETVKKLSEAKRQLESILGINIYGFRSHKLRILPSNILKDAGFTYDNSCHPTYVPGRYFNVFKSRRIKNYNGLIEVPISVTPILRLPISWIWFRNFGLSYTRFCTSWILARQNWFNIYFHSWDFADIDDTFLKLPNSIIKNSGKTAIEMFDCYLKWCVSKGIKAETIYNYLVDQKFVV